MNKSEANTLNREIRQVIEPVLQAHGLKLKSANATFTDSTFNLSVKSIDPNAAIPEWHLESVGRSTRSRQPTWRPASSSSSAVTPPTTSPRR